MIVAKVVITSALIEGDVEVEGENWYVRTAAYREETKDFVLLLGQYKRDRKTKADMYAQELTLEQEMKEITGRGRKHPDLPPC